MSPRVCQWCAHPQSQSPHTHLRVGTEGLERWFCCCLSLPEHLSLVSSSCPSPGGLMGGQTSACIPAGHGSIPCPTDTGGSRVGSALTPPLLPAASIQGRLPAGEGGEGEAEEAAETAQTGGDGGKTLPGWRGWGLWAWPSSPVGGAALSWAMGVVAAGCPWGFPQHLSHLLAGFRREVAPRATAGAAGPCLPHVPIPVQFPCGSPHVPRL